MQTIRIFHTDIKKYLIYLLATLFLALCSCKKESVVNPADDGTRTPDKIIVYTNYGTVFSYIDCNTFEITKTITMDIPETFKNRVRCMCTSANKEYLVFTASTGSPSFMQNIITYSIKGDSIYNIFPTGLDSVSAPRLISANIPEKPGLIYFFSCTKGLYQIDFLSKEVKKLNETSDYIDKEFYQSPDGKWIIVNNSYSGTFSDLEFYNRSTGLNLPEFTLNKNNCDSIYIDDIAFSENNKSLLQ